MIYSKEEVQRDVTIAMMEARDLQFAVPIEKQNLYFQFLAKPMGYKTQIREIAKKWAPQ